MTLKSLEKLVEISTGTEWRVDRRTRGQDIPGVETTKPQQTWIIILSNAAGHRQFVPEARMSELFRPKNLVSDQPTADAEQNA